ncbi:probable serine/threonine-protein kinase samkC [Homarus americanus]|uniref:BZIP domain-containing protein n=1 Tax=Homarus americanus TaxID=6706 RepID=A0A8J5NBP2_HOMAM|nr:probable serine/threonine-protein kinase samkC [Homarus americanus]KAG7177040.1 hypothetical protein Hamer_G000261 [Homarus americanus]
MNSYDHSIGRSMFEDIISYNFNEEHPAQLKLVNNDPYFGDSGLSTMSQDGLYEHGVGLSASPMLLGVDDTARNSNSVNNYNDADGLLSGVDLPLHLQQDVNEILQLGDNFPLMDPSVTRNFEMDMAIIAGDPDTPLNMDTFNLEHLNLDALPDYLPPVPRTVQQQLPTHQQQLPTQQQQLPTQQQQLPTQQQQLPTQQQTRRRRKPTRKNSFQTLIPDPQPFPSSPGQSAPLYPPIEDLGVTSPAYSLTDSDPGSSGETNGSRPRQRRPRVSYSTLTEEEKYHRIRDLNNEASRHYRKRHQEQVSSMKEQEAQQLEKNKVLQMKAAGLQKLRDQMETYTHSFLRQHMSALPDNFTHQ